MTDIKCTDIKSEFEETINMLIIFYYLNELILLLDVFGYYQSVAIYRIELVKKIIKPLCDIVNRCYDELGEYDDFCKEVV